VQRKGVREVMLPSGSEHGDLLDAAVATSSGLRLGLVDKDKEIDVDTWEEGDSLASLLTAQVWRVVFFNFSFVLYFFLVNEFH
jgi:hypothetical protein